MQGSTPAGWGWTVQTDGDWVHARRPVITQPDQTADLGASVGSSNTGELTVTAEAILYSIECELATTTLKACICAILGQGPKILMGVTQAYSHAVECASWKSARAVAQPVGAGSLAGLSVHARARARALVTLAERHAVGGGQLVDSGLQAFQENCERYVEITSFQLGHRVPQAPRGAPPPKSPTVPTCGASGSPMAARP